MSIIDSPTLVDELEEPAGETEDASPLTAETLLEEVSIDGMCGVY